MTGETSVETTGGTWESPASPSSSSCLSFSNEWQVLGPFQIGTREWGSDPLERLGGFHSLKVDPKASFVSSLAHDGRVRWSTATGNASRSHAAVDMALRISFHEVDWPFLKSVYGWSSTQYQTWARSEILVSGRETYAYELYAAPVLDLWVDDEHYYGGDVFGFSRAPIVLHFSPGHHQIDLRLVREVRAMGGFGEPTIDVLLRMQSVDTALVLVEKSILLSDQVEGRLASPYGSLQARNTGLNNLEIVSVRTDTDELELSLLSTKPLMIVPGQTRPLTFRIHVMPKRIELMKIVVVYRVEGESHQRRSTLNVKLRTLSLHDVHKMTYLHPSGTVSYAMIRPPPSDRSSSFESPRKPLPVLLSLHGAGIEAGTDDVSHSLDAVDDLPAWTIFPSGVTSWCGDDWHQWGWGDVEASLAAISLWIENVGWQGCGADTKRLLLVGHSNGGQGVWYGLLHHPDRMLAAAPISGYASIQKYVPYHFWRETDPRRTAVAQAALNSYRHELLLENAKEVPVLVQHGNKDDNVPVFHSRRMVELASQSTVSTEYNELEGKGHWFDGIMTTSVLRRYYKQHLTGPSAKPNSPPSFELIVANPADTGSKFGFRVHHLLDPGQLGSLKVVWEEAGIRIATSNVLAFSGKASILEGKPIWIDEDTITSTGSVKIVAHSHFTRGSGGTWQTSSTPVVFERRGNQLGNMDAILRTRGPFTICYHDFQAYKIALQIARNMFNYFGADARIVDSSDVNGLGQGNVIRVGIASSLSYHDEIDHPIKLAGASVSLLDKPGDRRTYAAREHGLAAVFLRPLEDERLELVVWGSDLESLRTSARLVPMMTGAAQPDFVVMTREALWRGLDGTLAMGFFDAHWKITRSSFLF